MIYKLKIIFLGAIAVFTLGCSASEMFTFIPDKEKVDTENGTEIAFIEDEYIFSNIEFEEQSEGNFIFYVFLFNKSDENIKLDPSEIRMIAFDENKNPVKNIPDTYFAIDPHLMVGQLNEDINNRETEHDVTTGFNIITAIVSTAVDLSNDNDNNLGEVIENVAVFTDKQIHEEAAFSNDVEYLENQKAFWKNEVLPPKELSGNEDIGGLVFIPACPEAAYIKVIIPFEKTKHTYFFKKEKVVL